MDASNGNDIVIYGGGSLGRELENYIISMDNSYGLIYWSQDGDSSGGKISTHRFRERSTIKKTDIVYMAIGDCFVREVEMDKMKSKDIYPTIFVHPSANWSSIVDRGSTVMPFCLSAKGSSAGKGLLMNTYSSYGHDVIIGDYCTMASYVCLCGGVKVGHHVTFGVGSKVLPGITIGDGCTIGAGAIVVSNVKDGDTVFGNPAVVIGSRYKND